MSTTTLQYTAVALRIDEAATFSLEIPIEKHKQETEECLLEKQLLVLCHLLWQPKRLLLCWNW